MVISISTTQIFLELILKIWTKFTGNTPANETLCLDGAVFFKIFAGMVLSLTEFEHQRGVIHKIEAVFSRQTN